MQSLEVDEARLTEQKEHLTILLNQLETKAKEEFKKRKQKVDRLNSEILDLQEKCNKLVYRINEGARLECSETTRLEDKDVEVKEPDEIKVLQAVPEGLETAPTEDKKVMPPQAITPKRNRFFSSS